MGCMVQQNGRAYGQDVGGRSERRSAALRLLHLALENGLNLTHDGLAHRVGHHAWGVGQHVSAGGEDGGGGGGGAEGGRASRGQPPSRQQTTAAGTASYGHTEGRAASENRHASPAARGAAHADVGRAPQRQRHGTPSSTQHHQRRCAVLARPSRRNHSARTQRSAITRLTPPPARAPRAARSLVRLTLCGWRDLGHELTQARRALLPSLLWGMCQLLLFYRVHAPHTLRQVLDVVVEA